MVHEKKKGAKSEPLSAEEKARGLYEFLMEPDRPHFSDFTTVSESMMDGYAQFISLGLPRHTIALAMLGGAVNLYQLFDMRGELPALLRSIADLIESETEPH